MAEEKKDAKPSPSMSDPFVEIISWFFVAYLIISLLNGFAGILNSEGFASDGWSRLTPKGIILAHSKPVSSLENPIGAKVVTINPTTAVYDSPGGNKIGTQPFNARGKISQGPTYFDGERYWYVDFDNGKDGWVKESDIVYLESEPSIIEKVIMWFFVSIPYLKFFSILLTLLLFSWIIYTVIRLTELRKNQYALLYPTSVENRAQINPKWEKVLVHINSLNENDWKLAIIEADIILEDVLNKLSLPGETMGDKMKAVEKSDFNTIDFAWEAHKIRNQIVHEGSDFILTAHEARRVVGLYQSIFEEFQVI